jgi:hypothetical protein
MTRFMFPDFQRQTRMPGHEILSTPAMRLRRFVQVDVAARLWERRWLLPLLVASVIALIFRNNLHGATSQGIGQANSWDLLLRVFANPYGIFYCFTPLYLYLVSDLQSESGFAESLLLRVQSRSRWWFGKVITLSLLVCAYLLLLIGPVVAIATFSLPWEHTWSQPTLSEPIKLSLPPGVFAYTPASAFGWLVCLLAMGWLSLGLLVLVGSQIFRDEKWGFGIGMLINLSGVIALHSQIAAPYDWLFINYHIILGTHAFGDAQSPYPSLAASCLYWATWIGVLLMVGWQSSKRRDFLRKG